MDPLTEAIKKAEKLSRAARDAASRGDQDQAVKLRQKYDELWDEIEARPMSDFNATPQYRRQQEATR